MKWKSLLTLALVWLGAGSALEPRLSSTASEPVVKPLAKRTPALAPEPASEADPATTSEAKPVPDSPWTGFRGIPWGANIAEYPDMVIDHDAGRRKTYTRKGEKLAIGSVELLYIKYSFFDGRFYHVRFRAFREGILTVLESPLDEILIKRFGHPEAVGTTKQAWAWTEHDVSVLRLRGRSRMSELTDVTMWYIPISNEAEIAKRAGAEERAKKAAASDF